MKKPLVICGALIAGAAVIYLQSALFFANRFQFNTRINGQDVSLKTAQEAKRLLLASTDNYALILRGRDDLTDMIRGSDVGLTTDVDGSVEALVGDRSNFTWFESLSTPASYELPLVGTSVDGNALQQAVKNTVFFDPSNIRQPSNATYEEHDGIYEIVLGDPGADPDAEKVSEAAREALLTLSPDLTLDSSNCYRPAVPPNNAELTDVITKLNTFSSVNISIPFGDTTETLDAGEIGTWIHLEDDNVILDEEKVAGFVDDLAEKYDTFGTNREFKTHDGHTETISAGTYGWWMDRDATTKELIAAINEGLDKEMEPVYFQKAAQFGEQDYGNSYAEVDLDNQHVYIYKDGEVVTDTDCVSGKAINGHCTPDGIYPITFKAQDTVLVGEDYRSPVKYWMPFNLGVGFHDANWRGSFGGDIYVRNGSHGCVNLPPSKAGEVYANVERGMAVIVYGGMTQSEALAYTGQPSSAKKTASSSSSSSSSSSGRTSSAGPASSKPAQQETPTQETAPVQDQTAAQQAETIAQAQANYESLGMTPEQAAAKVQADIAAQAAAQLAAQQKAAQQAATQKAAEDAAAAQAAAAQAQAAAQAAAQQQVLEQQFQQQYAAQLAAQQAAAAAAAAQAAAAQAAAAQAPAQP